MVSANGGSWSNISEEKNNKIKAFKFVKGDIIKIDINKKSVVLLKKQSVPVTKSAIYMYSRFNIDF